MPWSHHTGKHPCPESDGYDAILANPPDAWRIGQFGLISCYGRAYFAFFFFLAAFFSTRTPLNFLAAFFFLPGRFSAMNSPESLLRVAHADAPPSVAFV
jgi:hypothetical protein